MAGFFVTVVFLEMTLTGFDDEDDDIVDCSECKVVLS